MTRRARARRSAGLFACLALLGAIVVRPPAPAVALNDPLYDEQWGLHKVGAKAAWDKGLFGQGVDIAIVDSGVHLTHQDLVANLVAGRDFVAPNTPPQDDHSHGTHVAGIAAAMIDNGAAVGVAPKARIMPVKVLNDEGEGTTANVAAGITWAVDNGAEVVNLSLGSDLQGLVGPVDPIIDAVQYAWSKGSVCVFAAGNQFLLDSGFADERAIIVMSTDSGDDRSDFSNDVGAAQWGMAAPGGDDDVQLGPSKGIWSTVWTSDSKTNEYAEKWGTSMAAPFVSGAVAILRSAGLSPQAAVDRVLQTAKDLGPAGRDGTYGYGRLDIAKAVEGLSAPSGTGTGTGGGTGTPTGGGTTGSTTATSGSGTGTTATSGRATTGTRSTTRITPSTAPAASVPGLPTGDPSAGAAPPAGDDIAATDLGGRLGTGDVETGSDPPAEETDVPLGLAAIAAVLAVASGSGVGLVATRRRRY